MIVGVPKERKSQENRVGMVPAGVKALINAGAKVLVEQTAGVGSGISDEEFKKAGAELVSQKDVYAKADLIIKVKEPLPDEYKLYRNGQALYTYLHLAASKELTQGLMDQGIVGIAYETIQLNDGSLPLLKPMSEVAGRISVQLGAAWLQKDHDGKGILLGGVPGVSRGKVVILGAGIAGQNATKMAVGLGADVTVLDINPDKLEYLDDIYGNRIHTLYSSQSNIENVIKTADLVVGAVLIPGAKSPRLITKEMLKTMEPNTVLVDISVDQGGCFETTRPTTYDNPTYRVDDIVHYCVANMPGTVSRTSTFALTNVTLSYALKMVKLGIEEAIRSSKEIASGVNIYHGKLTHQAVAEAHGLSYESL
jgi:alanine dehydrogenase